MNKNKTKNHVRIAVISGVAIIYLSVQLTQINQNLGNLKEELRYQNHQVMQLKNDIETLRNENRHINKATYYIQESAQNKSSVIYLVDLEFTKDYKDLMTLYYKDINGSTWNHVELENASGSAKIKLTLDPQNDYELKVGYLDNDIENYETLPQLDIYSKQEINWMSDIQTLDVKKRSIHFNLQVAEFKNVNGISLEGVTCQVYYDEALVDSFELLEFMKNNEQKPPRNQLDRMEDEGYWFANKIVSLPDVNIIDPQKIRYEVIIENDQKNVFSRTYFVD